MKYRRPRLSRKNFSWTTFVIVLFILIGQHYGWFDWLSEQAVSSQPGLYHVLSVEDGDTIVIDMHGKDERIRFIGVDTPETKDPRKPVQCYGPEASAFTKRTIGTQRVRLASDPLSNNRDRYERLLRYVYLPDGTLVNQLLITSGYGFAYTSFPFAKSAVFVREEAAAQKANRGVWKHCQPYLNEYGVYTSNPR